MKFKIISLLIISSTLFINGCMIAGIGAGIAAVKYANAKKKESSMLCNKEYNNYISIMMKRREAPITKKEYCSEENP